MADRPNVLFVFTDDQRFDTVAALGNPAIRTPNMDRLVERGTAFTHAHIMGGSSPAVCMPSRAMLMTGRTLFRIEGKGQQIAEDHALLGETLKEAGYETFGAGKWHNGTRAYARSFTAGAEIFFGGMMDHWNMPACDLSPSGEYPEHPFCPHPMGSNLVRRRYCDHIQPGVHSSELLADATIDFIKGHDATTPFFAYLSFLAPHDPRTMPKEFLDMYPVDEVDLPPNYMPGHPFDNGELYIRDEELEAFPRTESAIRRHIAEYYAMITHLDRQLGRVIEALEASGRAENTIIVFAGDNGLAVGRHGLMGKQNMYEHSVRVPLIFAGPGIPAGERRDALCYLIDIFPTLCELTGVDTPGTVEGKSLAGAMNDPSETVRDVLHLAYTDCQRAVRDRRYKLIEYVVENAPRVTQLFDLENDPHELTNLAGLDEHRETVARLRKELTRWRDELGDTREMGQRFWEGVGAGF